MEREHRRSVFRSAARRVRGEFHDSTWHAFWLTTVEDQRVAETAAHLNLSPGAVYTARSRINDAARRKTDIATEAWESVKFRFSVGNATQEAVAESRLRVEDMTAEVDQLATQLDLWHEAHDLIQKNRPTKPADNETAADESAAAPATEDATSSEITAPVEEGSEDATVESLGTSIAEPAAGEALKATES